MTYWRMQVHPGDSRNAIKHTVESISAGYIGLDFEKDVPDLITVAQESLPENQRNYWAFAHEMKIGDRVLLFAHHFPYYGDLVTDARKWEYISMTATITPLRDPESKSYQLIEEWLMNS